MQEVRIPEAEDGSGAVSVVVGRFGPLLLRGLTATLADDQRIRVLASGLDAPSLELALADSTPQVAIVCEDHQPSELDRFRAVGPGTGILVLADCPSGKRAIRGGVSYLGTTVELEELRRAVHLVALQQRVFASEDGQRAELPRPLENTETLTVREHQVLVLIADGRGDAEIALSLEISPRTAGKHVARIRLKLGVPGRHELEKRAAVTNWVTREACVPDSQVHNS